MDLITISTILFLLFLSCVLVRAFSFAKSDDTSSSRKEFLERESKANLTRKADISSLDYINIPASSLPLEKIKNFELEKDRDLYDKLLKLSERKILNLSGYSNTDLKLMYGPANLEVLSQYDANYANLIKLLDKIGTCFFESDMLDDAKCILEYAISIGSDLSSSYVTLANIYASQNLSEEFKKLRAKAAAIESLSRDIIVKKLKEITF